MMKIATNQCFGGFSVSEDVFKELGLEWDGYGYLNNETFGIESDNDEKYRTNPSLISAIEKIGEAKASGEMADIEIVDIPDDIEWYIHDYNGMETVHEKHKSW